MTELATRLAEAVGRSHRHDFTVEGWLVTDVAGTLAQPVLSTPGMIGMLEHAAILLLREHVGEALHTVGFEVSVRHVGGAVAGDACTAVATLREVVDGRKLRFDVEALHGERRLGVGTHERRVLAPRPDRG